MAENFTASMLEQVSILDVITHFNIDRRGSRFTHQCQDFSGNSSHYATLYLGGNDFYCHRCRRFGGPVELVMDHEQVPRHKAVSLLADAFELKVDRQDLAEEYIHTLYTCLTDAAAWYHENLLSDPNTLAWVEERWGLTRDTIVEAKLGLGYPLPIDSFPHPTQVMMDVGLLWSDATHAFDRRLTIPTIRNGRVVYLTGRATPNQDGPKYLNLKSPRLKPMVYGYDEAYRASNPRAINGTRDVLLCEGQLDALAARQVGISALAIGRKESGVEGLADVVKVAHRSKSLFVVFDNEANQVGQQAAERIGKMIVGMGYDPIIVDLPRGADEDKVDLASYLKQYAGDATPLHEVLDEHRAFDFGQKDPMPVTYINRRIATLTYSANPKTVEEILKEVSRIPATVSEKYLRFMAAKTGIGLPHLKKSLTPKAKAPVEMTSEFAEEDDPGLLFYSQDYRVQDGKWVATKLLYVPMREQSSDGNAVTYRTVTKPYIVVTEMDAAGWRVLRHEAIDKEGLEKAEQKQIPAYMPERVSKNNWSVRTDVSHSLPLFLRHDPSTQVDPHALYTEMVTVAKRYLYLVNEVEYHLLATYAFLTYCFMGLPAVPYLFFYGEHNTGKSTAKEYLTHLAFQALDLVNLKEAQLYREAHARRCTLFLDEGEKLYKANGEGAPELLSLFNAGYRNNGSWVCRINGDSMEPEYFNPYGPKVVQSTLPLVRTLASRCIQISFRTMPTGTDIRSLGSDELFILDQFQELRNQLFCWSMSQFHTFYAVLQQVQQDQFHGVLSPDLRTALSMRGGQLWFPILAFHRYLTGLVPEHQEVLDLLMADIPTRIQSAHRGSVSDMRAAVLEALADKFAEPILHPTPEGDVLLEGSRIFRLDGGKFAVDVGYLASKVTEYLLERNIWRTYWELKRDDLVKILDKLVDIPKATVNKRVGGKAGARYRCSLIPMAELVREIQRLIKVESEQQEDEVDDKLYDVG